MKERNLLLISLVFVLPLLSMVHGCEKISSQDTGILKGIISIGPLCPVETDPPDPDCLPTEETYKAYPVSVWSLDGRRKLADLSPALDGSYSFELSEGSYLVRMSNSGGIATSNLPAAITINPFDTTVLDISIDTGIR